MKACGIIAEYNPFHLGHRYQLEEARNRSQADVMVVAMSGNFVQRGEPAIENKWYRAQEALSGGADLVLEIPTLASCQAADWFATAGVGILLASGCQAISFGVETEDTIDFAVALQQWEQLEQHLRERLTTKQQQQFSYAKRLSMIVQETYGEESALYLLLQQPNQQLAFSYLKALSKQQASLEIYPIERKGSHHHETQINETVFASGTALRQALIQRAKHSELQQQLPYLAETLSGAYSNHWEHYWMLLSYQLTRATLEELRDIYQVDEGIEYRIKKVLPQAKTFEQFITLLKNKRWTWARLQRMCVYILLGISKKEMQTYLAQMMDTPSTVTVLAFNQKGRAYLKELQQQTTQFLTNYANNALKQQQKIDMIYDIGNPTKIKSFCQEKPIMD